MIRTWPPVRAARALDRARCIVPRGRLVRGPWRVPGGRLAVAPGARSVGRWPCLVRPGAWSVGRDPCDLVRDLVAELRDLVRDLVRDPWRVRPGGPRPWRVRLVAWPTVPGPRPPVPGPRPPPPGPKNGPGRVLRGLLPDFTLSVVPKTVFLFQENRPPSRKTRFGLAIFRGTNTIRSMKTTCSKCGQPNDRLPQRYCRSCHAAYARDHRPRHVDLPPEQRQRANARAYANVYQRRGKITPEPCSVCHDPVAQKHHDDYSKPLQVRWLCRKCHLTLHLGDKTLHVEPS